MIQRDNGGHRFVIECESSILPSCFWQNYDNHTALTWSRLHYMYSFLFAGMICEDVDIRNDVNAFAELENCTVIEGNLKILLIEGASHQQYENLYFPDLVEITDFFLLYRVYGLKSLRHIFPNLSIIRGHKLFFNFALVVFELMDLEELGLIGLTTIERGAVRFEKNPQLCYIDTIDWTKIAVGVQGMSEHYFKQNRIVKECVDVCPSNCASTPVIAPTGEVSKDVKKRCWTKSDCQKILSEYLHSNVLCFKTLKLNNIRFVLLN